MNFEETFDLTIAAKKARLRERLAGSERMRDIFTERRSDSIGVFGESGYYYNQTEREAAVAGLRAELSVWEKRYPET